MHYALCIMHWKKGHLEPHSGGKPQPWVITHGRQTIHTEPRSGDITQPWVTTHGLITAARRQNNRKRSANSLPYNNYALCIMNHALKKAPRSGMNNRRADGGLLDASSLKISCWNKTISTMSDVCEAFWCGLCISWFSNNQCNPCILWFLKFRVLSCYSW